MSLKIEQNFSLKAKNTFGIDVSSTYFTKITSIEELQEALFIAKSNQWPFLFLGGGSNILFTKDFEGLTIELSLKGKECIKEDEHHYYVRAMAGENWHEFVLYCIDNQYAGIENLSLIPGSCGAAPMQNIGAYGVETKDVLYQVEALEIETGKMHIFSNEECRFGYRESVFKRTLKNKFVVIAITLKLNKIPVFRTEYGSIQEELDRMSVSDLSIKAISNAVINIRQSKLPDPKDLGNAGSFFKNPVISLDLYETLQKQYQDIPGYKTSNYVKVPAGWLIEKAGWKGKKIGACGVHEKQALVLVNYGNATGNEVYNLSENIIQDIKKHFSIELEREVNIY